MVLNLFGIVVATCMIYNMEFKGRAVKKMYMLPVSVPAMYLCCLLYTSMNDLRQYALQAGFAADNLEDVFLSMVEKDNMNRKQRLSLIHI